MGALSREPGHLLQPRALDDASLVGRDRQRSWRRTPPPSATDRRIMVRRRRIARRPDLGSRTPIPCSALSLFFVPETPAKSRRLSDDTSDGPLRKGWNVQCSSTDASPHTYPQRQLLPDPDDEQRSTHLEQICPILLTTQAPSQSPNPLCGVALQPTEGKRREPGNGTIGGQEAPNRKGPHVSQQGKGLAVLGGDIDAELWGFDT